MQISALLALIVLFHSLLSSNSLVSEPSPAPISGEGTESPPIEYNPRLPKASESSPVEAPAAVPESPVADGATAPAPDEDGSADRHQDSDEAEAPSQPPEKTEASTTVRWCAVGDQEFADCQYLVSLFLPSDGYSWQCVKRDTAQDCMASIKQDEADLVNLEASLAYTAFVNYSMKAIANELYLNRAETYNAVAIVNRKACEKNKRISLIDFKGHKSCHGGYSLAAGWNYPIAHIKNHFHQKTLNDQEIALSFFSKVCAPPEFGESGICNGCANANGSCHYEKLYFGYPGAFRCLVEGLGDIAFLKGDTALLYSMEGPQNQSWSKKSVRDFMYLCPQGGCREINGYPGSCSFGEVPANAIMASNSIANEKKLFVLQKLLNDSWVDELYAGEIGANYLLSSSTQGMAMVKKLTRSYLGMSASISESLQGSNTSSVQGTPSPETPVADVSSSPEPGRFHPLSFISLLSPFTVISLLAKL